MPGDPGVTVVTNARVYYTTRAAAGAPGARHSLRPLFPEGGRFLAKLALTMRLELCGDNHTFIAAQIQRAPYFFTLSVQQR